MLNSKKIVDFLCSAVFVLTIAIVVMLCLASIFCTYIFPADWDETPLLASARRVLFSIAGAVIVGVLLFKFLNNRNFEDSKKIRYICAAITFFIALLWCIFVNVGPCGDSNTLFELTKARLRGDTNPEVYVYLEHFPYQWGYFLYLLTLGALFGTEKYIAFRLLNIVCVALIVTRISKIAQLITKREEVGSLAAIVATIFLPLPLLSFLIYGNIPSLCFCLIATEQAILISKDNNDKLALRLSVMLVSLFVALWFKLNAIIFLIAIGVWFLILGLRKKKTICIIPTIMLVVVYFLTNFVEQSFAELLVPGIKFTGTPLSAWLAVGLQEESLGPGWYNSSCYEVWTQNNGDSSAITAASIQSINESLSRFATDPAYVFYFFAKKICTQWCEPTFQSLWTPFSAVPLLSIEGFQGYYDFSSPVQTAFMSGLGRTCYEVYCDSLQIVIYTTSIFGLLIQLREHSYSSTLLVIAFCGGFIYFLLFEAKSLYVMPYFLLLIPFSGKGMLYLKNKINSLYGVSCLNKLT